MKKIFLTMMVAIATSAFGINPNLSGVFSKLNNETTLKRISQYLNADESQTAELETIFYCTNQLLKTAKNESDESFAASAINYNLSSVRSVLTSTQYSKYLSLINLSVSNSEKNFADEK